MSAEIMSTDLTAEQARTLTDQAKALAAELVPIVAELFRGRAHLALGYDSWDTYRAAEFPSVWVQVEAGQRPDAARELRAAGMSQRQVAGVLGVGLGTVQRDIGHGQPDDPNGSSDARTLMSGGREYTRSRPEPAADPLPADVAEQIDERIAAKRDVAAALDRYAPDPEAPVRQWRIAFLAALRPAFRVPAQFAVEQAAEQIDDECLDELRRAAEQISDYYSRVKAARPIPDNVRHLRAVQ